MTLGLQTAGEQALYPLEIRSVSGPFELPHFRYVDPCEIQCWPPTEVEEALARSAIQYPELLEGIAGLLIARSPRFAHDLAPFFVTYFHPHNFEKPLAPDEEQLLRGMIEQPETIDLEVFERLAPIVLHKSCTLAVETFIQNRPAWVLKAIENFGQIRTSILAAGV